MFLYFRLCFLPGFLLFILFSVLRWLPPLPLVLRFLMADFINWEKRLALHVFLFASSLSCFPFLSLFFGPF